MKELVIKVFKGKVCKFRPSHSNNLANDFRCYTNFEGSLEWEENE